jgi:transposase
MQDYLQRHRICYTLPHKRNEQRDGLFRRDLYPERSHVEQLINRRKQFRRVATRYEKRAADYLAMLTIAAALLWMEAYGGTDAFRACLHAIDTLEQQPGPVRV